MHHGLAVNAVDIGATGPLVDARIDPTTDPGSNTAIGPGHSDLVTNSLKVGRVTRPINVAVGDGVSENTEVTPEKATPPPEDNLSPEETSLGATAVWFELLKATSSKGQCPSPPCTKVYILYDVENLQ